MSRRRRRSGGREREDYKYSVVGAWTKLAADPPAAHNLQPVTRQNNDKSYTKCIYGGFLQVDCLTVLPKDRKETFISILFYLLSDCT